MKIRTTLRERLAGPVTDSATETVFHKLLGVGLSLALATLLTMSIVAAPTPPVSPAAKTFESFRALAGDWQGTTNQGDTIRMSYQLVAGGSAVLEQMELAGEDGAHDMVTLYHLDGDALMLTHYCSSKNQPRMRAASPTSAKRVKFEFVDVTNLPAAGSGHMHHAEFEFPSPDRLKTAWTWREDGKDLFTVEVDAQRLETASNS